MTGSLYWMDIKDVADYCRVSDGTVDNWIKNNGFPPARLRGGKRFWKRPEVDSWMEGDEVKLSPDDDLGRRIYEVTKAAARG